MTDTATRERTAAQSRDAIVDATMALLADRPFEDVTLRTIAAEAGVSLAVLNTHFSGRGAIIDAFARRIDHAVLETGFDDMVGETPRDRLFDVLMARLDALTPYRAAIKGLMRAVRRDPALGFALNAIATRSMGWMLAAAGLSAPGWRGRIAVQALTVGFAQVLRVFVDEADPGMPQTMARLDKELRDLEAGHHRLQRLFGGALRRDGADGEAEDTGDAVAPFAAEAPDGAAGPAETEETAGFTGEPANGVDTPVTPDTKDDDTDHRTPTEPT